MSGEGEGAGESLLHSGSQYSRAHGNPEQGCAPRPSTATPLPLRCASLRRPLRPVTWCRTAVDVAMAVWRPGERRRRSCSEGGGGGAAGD